MLTRLPFLTIEIGLDPTLFEIGGLEITWHGLFTALGVVAGVAVAAYLARRAAYPEEQIYNVALALVIGGIIGARALYVLEHLDDFAEEPLDIFAINTGGISIYGALIGGTIGAVAYALIARVANKWKAADIAALGAIIGMAVGRIGDVINGEHFAETTDLPWGVQYTHENSPSFAGHPLGPSVVQHPAVGYELLADLAIFAALLLIYRRGRRDGLTFLSWAFLYAAMRLGISFLRLDDIVWAGLRTAQIIAIVVMVLVVMAALYMAVVQPRRPARAERRRLSRAERRRLARQEASDEEPS